MRAAALTTAESKGTTPVPVLLWLFRHAQTNSERLPGDFWTRESPDGSPQTTDLTAGLMVYTGDHAWDFRLTPNPCWCRELLGLDAAT